MITIGSDIPYQQFVQSLNLSPTDTVLISSDLGKLARSAKECGEIFNVDKLIEALQTVLNEGTIILPAYTDNLISGDVFDHKRSKPTTGALSNRVMSRKDFQRSEDPLHSVFVWGRYQSEILALTDQRTFGPNSIFGFLHRTGGKFIFLDVHIQSCFTYVHYVEERLNASYRKDYKFTIECVKEGVSQNKEVLIYSKRLGVQSNILAMHDLLMKEGGFEQYRYRSSQINILSVAQADKTISDCIQNGPKLYTFSRIKFMKDFIKRSIFRKKGIL